MIHSESHNLLAEEALCLQRHGEESFAAQDYARSLDYFLQAESLYDILEDQGGQAEALNSIGTSYFMLEDYHQAIQFYLQAFRLRETLGDLKGVACSLNNIGNTYGMFEDFENSVRYYEKCLPVCRENGQTGLESVCLANLAKSLTGLGRLTEAVLAGKGALSLARKLKNARKQCHASLTIGCTYEKDRKYTKAISWFTKAKTLALEFDIPNIGCEAQLGLGNAYLSLAQMPEARNALILAEEAAAALSLKRIRSQALSSLSQLSEQEGDPVAALSYHKQFYTLEKQLSHEVSEKRSQALMMQMEVEKVLKEAQIHRYINTELTTLNAALEDANRTLQVQAKLLESQGEELRAQAKEMQRQANEDGLTGLANRRHLEGWLAAKFHNSRLIDSPLTVVMADVDHFKQINDRFGHQIGDEVLMSVGLMFRQACRVTDLAARYGGEEFVLALPETDALAASVVCERLRQTVEGYFWQSIHPDLSVTISLGLSDDPYAASHERLLALADAQLYDAKKAGRNRISLYPALCDIAT